MRLRAGSPEEAGIRPEAVEQIRKKGQAWTAAGSQTPALVLVAARRGIIFFHEAFGRHGPGEDSPKLVKNALFPLASMSKPITATAAMILVEDGLLGLNRPVQEYIPEFKGNGKEQVIVHQLLTHTSGLRDDEWTAIIEEEGDAAEIPPTDETMHLAVNKLLYALYRAPLGYSTGAEMIYSSANYYLAGEIVRRLSGLSLDQFARERIFDPLGMDDTYYVVPEGVQNRVVLRPEDAPGASMQDKEYMERPSPSGGVFSTALDMARFGQMFLNDGAYGQARVLSPATVAAMTRDQIPGVGASLYMFIPIASWGLGWSVGASYKGRVYGEFLPAPGYFNHGGYGGVELWADPANEIVGVYFSVALDVDLTDFPIYDADLYMNMVTAGVVYDERSSATASISLDRQTHLEPGSAKPSRIVELHQRKNRVLRPGSPEEVGVDPERVKMVVDLANNWVESGMHPSLNIVAARHRVLFLDETLGRMGPETDARPLAPDTLFPLASITKPITATAVMILVDEGLVSLNRPVTEYLQGFQVKDGDKILIRHLLTHTSGLREPDLLKLAEERGLITGTDDYDENISKVYPYQKEYIALIQELSPAIPPDKTMNYATSNYDLLTEVVAEVSGMSFSDFVRLRIFEPLGLDDTFLPIPGREKGRVVRRPEAAPFNKILTAILKHGPPSVSGGFSNAMNMAIFGQMFLNGGIYAGNRILSAASVEAMTRDQTPGILAEYEGETIGEAEWGLGWSIHNNGRSRIYDEPLLSQGSYSHGGIGGVFIWVDPVKDLVAVFFSTTISMNRYEWPAAATDLFINSLLASIVED